ncbi:restriction endonuclease [Streptomyces albireticuli]|uniref:restriction endonuclease n=2 Tax=Streptomyces albireticuli TaxID=1940 RepID=UPI001E46AAF9|nr:restriction endonuclease [Streptomyces albireticuli]MCD9144404.1 restriction endonuclease [Streptomyces albireticuli]MCD9163533.1 restriction endonuclease [Streptomyces albireticuli]MCD9193081.1 restriction endonuclease [Streptomyces albireticuli]
MSRRSNGLIGIWAEAQRQQQRQREAEHRERTQAQREQERQQRAYEREAARLDREQRAAYRQRREAEARRRTEELDARVAELTGVLLTGCGEPAFTTAALRRPEEVEPFQPGHLAHPVPMPDPARYRFARAQFEQDWHAAQRAETQRRQQLAAYRQQYEQWAADRLAETRAHNAGVEEMTAALRRRDPDAVVEYFSAALYASSAWPEEFPHQVSAAYDPGARQLVLTWELPGYDLVPAAKSVRYMPTADQDRETARPAAQRRAVHRDVLAQSMLLVLRELFAADEFGALESVSVNGFVDDHDPATGHRAEIVLATVAVSRPVFDGLRLEQVSAVDCLTDGLGGQLSARPDQLTAVRPGRMPDEVGQGVVSHGGGEDPDLYAMDPVEFEGLVAQLFRARGMRAVMTQRSNDGGVDVEALDPDPISGGRIIVQVKRYRKTVPPTAVRDLYGTVQGAGANKGVLVTTSGFGPGSYAFANGKPLTLVSGEELVGLLGRHGLRGRLGDTSATPPRRGVTAGADTGTDGAGASAGGTGTGAGSGSGAGAAPEPDASHNVLGMSWSGGVALDICALVCRGTRVLSDDHFVFFNNPVTPDGSVRSVPPAAADKAAVRVSFDTLPADADRLVLAAAVDPQVDPRADLTGFTDARIRLCDASGAELGRLEVSDGRPGETALVLGSFRRRGNGDWDFVLGGQGYEGGLEALVREYGIEVA